MMPSPATSMAVGITQSSATASRGTVSAASGVRPVMISGPPLGGDQV